MLVNKSVRRVDLPHEPGQWVEVRPLSWADSVAAKKAASEATLHAFRDLGTDFLSQLQSLQSAPSPADAAEPAPANPLAGYDRRIVLERGLVAWSYDEPVTPENISLLDEQTAEVAALAIVSPLGQS